MSKTNSPLKDEISTDRQLWKRALPAIMFSQLGILALALIWGHYRQIPYWEELCFTPSLPVISVSLALGVAISLATNSYCNHRIKKGDPSWTWVKNELLSPIFRGTPLAIVALLAITSSFCEEIFFRGILYPEFGLVASSIIFGILHGGHKYLFQYVLLAIAMGMILAYIAGAGQGLWPAIAVHCSLNATSLLKLR